MLRSPRLRAAAFTLAGLAVALPGFAQAPPAPEASAESVPLVYKHKIGDLVRYRGNVKMDLAVSPEGGGAGLGSIPVTGSTVFAYTEKVTGTRMGTATVSMTMQSLTTSLDVLGQKSVTKLQNGKTTVSVNGKPVPLDSPEARSQVAQLKKPVLIRRTPLGLVTPVGSGNSAFAGVFGGNTPSILQFVEQTFKPGDTRETSQTFRPSLAGSGSNRVVIPAIDFKYTHTLRGFATKNGRRTALIDTTGSGATEGGDNTVNQSVTGATRFDLERGVITSSQYNIILSLRISPPGAAAQGGPSSVRLDGSVDVTMMEAAPTPKKPAPKR
jgi:hypothetical protein